MEGNYFELFWKEKILYFSKGEPFSFFGINYNCVPIFSRS